MKNAAFTYLFAALLALTALFAARSEARAANFVVEEVAVSILAELSLAELEITPRQSAAALWLDGRRVDVSSDRSIELSLKGREIRVRVGRDQWTVSHVRLESGDRSSVDLSGSSMRSPRAYSGDLEITRNAKGTLRVINHVPIEDYVASVVGAEYGLKDTEGAKAMAVVARTYALHALKNGKSLLDSERSQVYRGLEKANEAARRAARETAGQVLTWKGDLIEAVYSSSNGGRTANNSTIWGTTQLPYLTSRKDKFDANTSPHANWTWEERKADILDALSSAHGVRVKGFKVTSRADDGRVESVRLNTNKGSRTITGTSLRATLARTFGATTVRSTYFDVKEKGKRLVFEGRGFGHGVGLSQWGAHGMALAGRSYDQILDFYYAGTRLDRRMSPEAIPTELETRGSHESSAFARLSIGDRSSSASSEERVESPSLDTVSNDFGTPKEIKSTISEGGESGSINARSIWGDDRSASRVSSDKNDEAKAPKKKKAKKRTRRAGW